MKTLYLQCNMGAAGDMLTAALLELHPDPADFLRRLNAAGLPGVEISAERSEKCGIIGTHMRVLVHGGEELDHHHDDHHHDDHDRAHEHHHDDHEPHTHNDMHGIRHRLAHLTLPEAVRTDVEAVYGLIAAAESHVHGRPVDEIHFHEVGTLDALGDITGVCWLMRELAPERVIASPIHVGSGTVRCAHGILPVPAPATAYILQGVPTYGGEIGGELCTPTGAALLKYYVNEFAAQPVMRVSAVGYGMGKKDFPVANCVRAMLGETAQSGDEVTELRCNLDDMSAEDIGFAMERLLEAGALDVFTQPIGMKKSRPGTMLTVLCRPAQRDEMTALLLRHTTTLGVRWTLCQRATLSRTERTVTLDGMPVRVKESSGWGVTRSKAEYEDLAALARQSGSSLAELRDRITKL